MHRTLALLLLLPAALHAQPASPLRRALLVGYSSNLTFAPFNGGSVSYKTERSPTRALRIGLDVFLEGQTSTYKEKRVTTLPGGAEDQTDQTRGTDSYDVEVNVILEAERYPARAGRMRPYVLYGVFMGPRFFDNTIDDAREESQDVQSRPPRTDTSTDVQREESDGRAWGGGLTGGLGVEWRVADDLSVLAEYRTRFYYSHSVQNSHVTRTIATSDDDPDEEPLTITQRVRQRSSQYGLRSDGLRVGAVLYF